MPRANEAVEQALLEFADLLSILSEDPFKPRAYEKAARAVGGYPDDLAGKEIKEILKVPGVGKSIGEKVHEFLTTGVITDLETLRAQIPAGVRDLMTVPGLGPKKAFALFEGLGIGSVDELAAAIGERQIADLKGFGPKTQENILRGITQMASAGGRVTLGVATDAARTLIEQLRDLPGVQMISFAGSLRRMRETIGDVDLLVASNDPVPIMEALVSHPAVTRVLARGESKSSVLVERGLQVDLRVVPSKVWGAAMIYFTGSKPHNVRIREMAVRAGLKLNEYGLFDAKTGSLLAAKTEAEVYERLGLPFIEPTLREDRGEIEAALAAELPALITQRQIRGDLHTHTDLTDGVASLEEMVAAAAGRGYEYYAVTDHAPDLVMQRMTTERMLDQRDRVRSLQGCYPALTLLHGTELNIGPVGELDWPDEFLADFDLTVASVHSHFTQSREEMTSRVLRAIENPHVDIIGHLTTRKVGRRPPVDLDLEVIFAAAARTGTALEVNAHPDRLDLNDEHILWAKRHGVRFAVNTDAHATTHLDLMPFGVGTAQRGWLTKADIINAWPLSKLQRFLARA
ncbi:MAG: DNA polymerase/3'-5' exonuclease PolX [Actinomycetota bacterium]